MQKYPMSCDTPGFPDGPPTERPAAERSLPRAWGEPVSKGEIRRQAEDFRVDELLGFEPSGEGAHVLLHVEKTGRNTVDVAGDLAAHARCHPRDLGYSGLKDKHAVCRQWFSVPSSPAVDWAAFEGPGIRVLRAQRHHRKLRRGTHRANRFSIRIVLNGFDEADLHARMEQVRSGGVPSYFGEQRFGRRYADNVRRLVSGCRLPRLQRGMTLSAIRADLFNRVLGHRVRCGTWNIALPGEYLNLDGTRSGFKAEGGDPDIAPRVAALDLHPTGPLFGDGPGPAEGEVKRLETELLRDFRDWCDVLVRHGMKMERRATRCAVGDLEWRLDAGTGILQLEFSLRRGHFATSVLREILDCRDATRPAPTSGPGPQGGAA